MDITGREGGRVKVGTVLPQDPGLVRTPWNQALGSALGAVAGKQLPCLALYEVTGALALAWVLLCFPTGWARVQSRKESKK